MIQVIGFIVSVVACILFAVDGNGWASVWAGNSALLWAAIWCHEKATK